MLGDFDLKDGVGCALTDERDRLGAPGQVLEVLLPHFITVERVVCCCRCRCFYRQ